ncbi:MAG: aldo/keto reductase, partial [Acidobacteriota bacterium]
MKMRPLGPTGASVPVIGQGTWDMEHDDRREAIRALQRGLELGMNHIDTAEMYGSGAVEQLVAKAIQG